MPKILIVEDDKPISDLIEMHLSMAGYEPAQMYSAEDALGFLNDSESDLILLDIMLPGMDGMEFFKRIQHKNIPVIYLTAKRELPDKIRGLKMGAEDYIVKPFEPIELITRIEVVLRRMGNNETLLTFNDVSVNETTRRVTKDGEEIELTPLEYDLLCVLVRYKRHVLTREQLLNDVWGYDYLGGTRTVDMHVQRLRKKLGWQDRIKTVYKIGYRLED